MRLRLPAELTSLEPGLRHRVQECAARGRVDVAVQVRSDRADTVAVQIRTPLVKEYLDAARGLKRQHRLRGGLTIDQVMSLPGVVQMVQPPAVVPEEATVRSALEEALRGFEAMRRSEGTRLAADLRRRLQEASAEVEAITEQSAKVPEHYAGRLKERVAALAQDHALDPVRLAQEVALLADRVDISEELVRLRGFLEQADATLRQSDGGVGKTLDFIMQEINREANTISSKSEALPICQAALRLRSFVEAVREQVQNLE